MRVLSVMQPYATLIVEGIKRFEARTWSTPFRGRFAVHASSKVSLDFMDAWDECDDLGERLAQLGWVDEDDLRRLVRRAVVGAATLVEVHEAAKIWPKLTPLDKALVGASSDEEEAPEDLFLWELRDAIEFPSVAINGKLNLWTLPDTIAADVGRRIEEARGKPVHRVVDATRVQLSKGRRDERRAESERLRTAAVWVPSPELAAVIGSGPTTRSGVIEKLWAYIKKHDLQHPKKPGIVVPDQRLSKVLGKNQIGLFEMTQCLNDHLDILDD